MAKKEYIEKSAIRQALYHEAFETDTEYQRWDSGCWIRYKLFENVVDALPAADVRPVKRSEWQECEVLTIKDTNIYELQSAFCPVCKRYHTTPFMYSFSDYNFCPNCGADMRKTSENK